MNTKNIKLKDQPLISHVLTPKRRTSRTMKGGKISSVGMLVVTGDGNGNVGIGYGKGLVTTSAINKANHRAQKQMFKVNRSKNNHTIPYAFEIKDGAIKIIMLPAPVGTGVVGSHIIKNICEAAGISDLRSKVHGSGNIFNIAMTTIKALKSIKPIGHYVRKRGLTYDQVFNSKTQ